MNPCMPDRPRTPPRDPRGSNLVSAVTVKVEMTPFEDSRCPVASVGSSDMMPAPSNPKPAKKPITEYLLETGTPIPPPPEAPAQLDAGRAWSAWVKGTLAPSDELPGDYGDWEDWDDPANLAKEASIAHRESLLWSQRGPLPPIRGGPMTWMGYPFNEKKCLWGWEHRAQLPGEYFHAAHLGWWTAAGLAWEEKMAEKYSIPWDLRGPPTGPGPNDPTIWNGKKWRPNACRWATSGGVDKEWRQQQYGTGASKGSQKAAKGDKSDGKGVKKSGKGKA